jgi:hypothetical protein
MEIEVLNTLQNSGITGVLIVALFMVYKTGKFFSPLIIKYIDTQETNSANASKILTELAHLQSIANIRLEAIEKQLTLFDGILTK